MEVSGIFWQFPALYIHTANGKKQARYFGEWWSMKLIADIEELEGKTISRASFVDCDEVLALVFTDDTYAAFKACLFDYGDYADLVMMTNVSSSVQRQAGVITKEEHEAILAKESEAREKNQTARELAELARLKEKHDDK